MLALNLSCSCRNKLQYTQLDRRISQGRHHVYFSNDNNYVFMNSSTPTVKRNQNTFALKWSAPITRIPSCCTCMLCGPHWSIFYIYKESRGNQWFKRHPPPPNSHYYATVIFMCGETCVFWIERIWTPFLFHKFRTLYNVATELDWHGWVDSTADTFTWGPWFELQDLIIIAWQLLSFCAWDAVGPLDATPPPPYIHTNACIRGRMRVPIFFSRKGVYI